MFQLLVMPLVAPRKMCINMKKDISSFPWEAAWNKHEGLCCEDKMKPEMKPFLKKAVLLKKNVGTWHISPLPAKFRKSDADIMRTDCIYYVDSNPGGDLSKLKSIVNKAQSVALPALMKNVLFHGKGWEGHLKKYHGPEMTAKYKNWQLEYKKAMSQK